MLEVSEKKKMEGTVDRDRGRKREIGRERKHLTGLIPKEIEKDKWG